MKILISGGGIAGLTLATYLLKQGITATVVEKQKVFKDARGFGVAIWGNGRKILKEIDLDKDLAKKGYAFPYYSGLNNKGKELCHLDMKKFGEKYDETLFINREEFHEILEKGAKKADIRMGSYIKYIDEKEDGVSVTFDDDTQEDYDLIVAADGINSYLREEIFQHRNLKYYGWTSWMFWTEHISQPPQGVVQVLGPSEYFCLYPVGGGKCFGYFASPAKPNTPETREERLAKLHKSFDDLGWKVPRIIDKIKDPDNIFHTDLAKVETKKWVTNRIALTGDAVHAFCPLTGMGCSLAMEDAWVLGEELKAVDFDPQKVSQALKKYEKRRKKSVKTVQSTSQMIWSICGMRTNFARKMTNLLLRVFPGSWKTKLWTYLLERILKQKI